MFLKLVDLRKFSPVLVIMGAKSEKLGKNGKCDILARGAILVRECHGRTHPRFPKHE